MVLRENLISIEEFSALAALPENTDKLFELIHGEMIEVSPGRTRNSELGHRLVVAVHMFCKANNLPCHTSGGDGAYQIGNDVVAPDFAYKTTAMSEEYPDPTPPLWAVEIISPTDKAQDIREKRQLYQQANILLWELYPQSPSVDVYAPGHPAKTYSIEDTLDGGNILPGFKLSVREWLGS